MRFCVGLQAVAHSPNPMELVVSSVCPEIFGHDFVKFGLALALFGEFTASALNSFNCWHLKASIQHHFFFVNTIVFFCARGRSEISRRSGQRSCSRFVEIIVPSTLYIFVSPLILSPTCFFCHCAVSSGDIHVLVVGDPGLGKSEMLNAVHKLAPRGIYVSGTTTSSSGLTVTLVRDTSSGEFGLEVGPLLNSKLSAVLALGAFFFFAAFLSENIIFAVSMH